MLFTRAQLCSFDEACPGQKITHLGTQVLQIPIRYTGKLLFGSFSGIILGRLCDPVFSAAAVLTLET